MYCGICGKQNKDDSKFCSGCGSALVVTSATPASSESQGTPVVQADTVVSTTSTTFVKPVVQDTTAATKVRKQKKIKPVKKMNTVLLVFLNIIMVLFVTVASLGITVRLLTNQESIEDIVEEIDIAELDVSAISGNRSDDSLYKLIYENIPNYFKEYASKKDIKRLLNKDFIKEFIEEELNEYVDDLFNDNGKGVVTTKELWLFVNRNVDEVFDELYISEYDYQDDFTDYVIEGAEWLDIEEKSSLDTYREDNRLVFSIISIVFSYPIITILLLEALLITVVIFLKNSLSRSGKAVGISLLIVAFINIIGALVIKLFENTLSENFILGSDLIEILVGAACTKILSVGLVILSVGLILIIIALISQYIKKIKSR